MAVIERAQKAADFGTLGDTSFLLEEFRTDLHSSLSGKQRGGVICISHLH
jgi:hypothetical protein